MPLVECRYAEALIEITEENCRTDVVLSDFEDLLKSFENNPELEAFLSNPNVQVHEKKKLLEDLFKGEIDENLLRLLCLLIDKSRTKHIKGILQEYKRFADKRKNVLNLKIISAVHLEELQIEKIKEKYAKIYKKDSVNTVVDIDSSLIGGIKVQIGDRIEDYSLKTRLDNLKNLLMER